MKTLLAALKAELPGRLRWIRDIEVVPDEYWIPEQVRFPFVGLKDGEIRREEGAGGTLTERLTVQVIVYQKILQAEASVMGSGDDKGVLDLVADIHGVLNENLLGLTGMEYAFCSGEEGSQTLERDSVFIQKKRCDYVYERTT